MKLKPTQVAYRFADESGYRFTVVATLDEEFNGWSASVGMETHGYRTPEDAVARLAASARAFLRQVEEAQP